VNSPKYSVIIPVFNRPDEIRDLMESLLAQTRKDFEIIVVEDGSTVTCEEAVREYEKQLPIRYYFKSNSGPGPARNFGYAHARGKYLVVFDSDCMLPPGYFEAVDQTMKLSPLDAWGGPDRGHEGFTVAQRAMAYTMSSVLTTGGIRGGRKRVGWFQPRSFNMGISKEVYEHTGGFRFDRYAEDIEFSIRIKKAGFRVGLISDAFVFHKRRANLFQFLKQVFNFGKGRALIGKVHPEEVRITHWFPACFTLATILLPLLFLTDGVLFTIAAVLFGSYISAIFFHAWATCRHPGVALMSVASALIQLWGYGAGFLVEKMRKAKL
jgi:glycosyltransferase involved in cell wall biosynthesis